MTSEAGANGGIVRDTHVHPLAMVMLAVAAILVFAGPRRTAAAAMLFVACFVSSGQDIVIFGASLYALRILVLVGLLRALVRNEIHSLRLNRIDTLVLLWCACGVAAYTIQQANFAGFVFKTGQSIDSAGAYFAFRCLFTSIDDLKFIVRWQAILAIPVVAAFLFEHATRYNPFSIFGGVPEITAEREGRFRCQGAFSHAILAGTFWASTLPLMAAMLWEKSKWRTLFAVGCACALLIIILCASSTPLLGVLVTVLGFLAFKLRNKMRAVRWSLLGLLGVLQIVMKAPVWSLLGRINLVAGSTGYYRYMLADAAIRHFGDWFAFGMVSNAAWGNEWGHYLTDITNQYVLEGLRGGVITLGLFIAIIWLSFLKTGKLTRAATNNLDRIVFWALGVTLAVHAACFLAVSYFGQIVVLFNMHLALIASAKLETRKAVHSSRFKTKKQDAAVVSPFKPQYE
jgi:hypothetical protein